MKLQGLMAAAALSIGMAGAAHAATTVCMDTDVSPTAVACAGFVDKNALGGSSADIATQKAELADIGFMWNGSTIVEGVSNLNGAHTVDFKTPLDGITYLGAHFGNGTGGPGNATAFYEFDFTAPTSSITLNYNASSNVVVYSTTTAPPPPPAPEPAVWGMMLVGFGAIGAAMRSSRRALAV